MLLALTLLAVGISCHNPAMQSLISQKTERQGEIFGILQALTSLARTIAPFGFALVAAAWGGKILYILLAAALVLLIVIAKTFAFLDSKPLGRLKRV